MEYRKKTEKGYPWLPLEIFWRMGDNYTIQCASTLVPTLLCKYIWPRTSHAYSSLLYPPYHTYCPPGANASVCRTNPIRDNQFLQVMWRHIPQIPIISGNTWRVMPGDLSGIHDTWSVTNHH